MATYRLLFRSLPYDCTLTYLEKRLLGALYDETTVLNFLDLSDDAAVGDDLVVYLQLRDHVRELLLLSLLRQKDKKIENASYQNERQEQRKQTTGAGAGILKKEQNYIHRIRRKKQTSIIYKQNPIFKLSDSGIFLQFG
jgi:hypothetical protein